MGRKRRYARIFGQFSTRLGCVKTINPDFDYGFGLNAAQLEQQLEQAKNCVNKYNSTLSHLDALLNELLQVEKDLKQLHHRLLLAVGAAHGFDSNEYEMAGGTRLSERKKYKRK